MTIILILGIIPAVLGLLLVKKQARMERYNYNQQFVTLAVVFVVGGILMSSLLFTGLGIIYWVISLILTFIVGRWVTMRIRDCGWPEWIRFLYAIPILGLMVPIAVMFPPTKAEVEPDLAAFD